MIRLLTAAALVALLSSPVMAQSVSEQEGTVPTTPNWERSTGSGTSDSLSGSQGLSGQSQGLTSESPTDCGPQDPRPECQTALLPEEGEQSQLPSDEPGMSGQSGAGDAPAEMPADDSRHQGVEGAGPSGSSDMNR